MVQRPTTRSYVKGYAIDWAKIKSFLDITDDKDRRIDEAMIQIMEYVDRSTHDICTAHSIGASTESFAVITFGPEACDADLNALKEKDIPTPRYLEKIAEYFLTGPDVFEFVNW